MEEIFLIEDDPLMIRMYERALHLNGLPFSTAQNGNEALLKLKEAKVLPRLILLDIMMPEKDGLTLLKELKQDSRLKDIPVIVITNLSAGEEAGIEALSLGAEAYLIKSQHTPKEITEKIKVILNR
jgi:CheY-like chemotaxis protein